MKQSLTSSSFGGARFRRASPEERERNFMALYGYEEVPPAPPTTDSPGRTRLKFNANDPPI